MHPLSETSHASAAARALKDPENRSIEIGIACTLAFHVLLAVLAPRFPVDLIHGAIATGAASDRGHEFNIELAPDIAAPEPKVDPFRFVETNPDAPENEPDQTANFSNRNQQLAQPEAAKEKSPDEMPSVKGQDLIKNETAIVSGERAEPQSGTFTVSTQPSETSVAAELAARAEQVPLSGTEKFSGEVEENAGSNISDQKSPSTNAEEYVEGVRGAKAEGGAISGAEAQATPRAPLPRQRVQARPTILTNRVAGTDRIGVLAAPAFRTEFGDYLDRFVEVVGAHWRNIVAARGAYPPSPSHATITFNLTADGEIKIISVEETCGKPGTLTALAGIQDGQPYWKWSDKMVAVLGREQQLVFSFHY